MRSTKRLDLNVSVFVVVSRGLQVLLLRRSAIRETLARLARTPESNGEY
jgi:hypothetical protein